MSLGVTLYVPGGITYEVIVRPPLGGGGGGTGGGTPSFTVDAMQLDLTNATTPEPLYQGSDRYGRFQSPLIVRAAPLPVAFDLTNIAAGGSNAGRQFGFPRYAIRVGAVEWGSYSRVATERHGTITVTVPAGVADDWYTGELVGVSAAGAAVPLCRFDLGVNRAGGLPNCPDVVKQTGSFEWVHPEVATPSLIGQPGIHARVRMPKAQNEPTARPLAPRVAVAFNTAGPYPTNNLRRENVVPPLDADHLQTWRTTYTDDGIATTCNLMPYFPEDWQLPAPRLSIIDGPRNIARTAPATDVLLRHGGGLDYSDAWGRRHVDSSGAVRTLYGLRHKRARYSGHDSDPLRYVAPSLNDPNVEIVGASGWPASVPMNQRFPWECWGFAFDKRTVGIDASKPLILVNGVPTPQHTVNPRAFFVDRFNRMVRVTWRGNADGLNVDAQGNVTDPATGAPVDLFALPPTFDIWVANLPDPWGLVCENGVIAVTVRGAHRLSEYSADAPETLLGHVIDNPHGATFGAIGPRRRFVISPDADNGPASWDAARAAAARADIMVAPDGLCTYVDAAGDRWYVWGSYAQGEVREINRRTKQWRVVCRPFVGYGAKSWFVYVKRSDGSFGPAGTIGTTTFSEAATTAGGFGRPEFFLPTPGTASDGTALTNSVPWSWSWATLAKVYRGRGGRTEAVGYAMAFDLGGVGPGRLVASSSQAGLDEWTLDSTEALPDEATCARGFAYWKSKHYYLRWGWTGYEGSDPLPWGENIDCDKWLHQLGHAP